MRFPPRRLAAGTLSSDRPDAPNERAAEAGMVMILLWMQGGPSHSRPSIQAGADERRRRPKGIQTAWPEWRLPKAGPRRPR